MKILFRPADWTASPPARMVGATATPSTLESLAMLKTLALIAMNWTVRDQDLSHVRCVRCHEIHSEVQVAAPFGPQSP
ncbi:hypothetical protein [Nonomuraea sp. NPDC049141]|uniref:hypothetical protein n=1 Tax=Nonomuraea sp. NPDC049141 TaxID=3155500 RepID=UPI0033CED16D